MYLHEPGEDADSYTREEMASGKHQEEGVNPSSLAMGKAPLGRRYNLCNSRSEGPVTKVTM